MSWNGERMLCARLPIKAADYIVSHGTREAGQIALGQTALGIQASESLAQALGLRTHKPVVDAQPGGTGS